MNNRYDRPSTTARLAAATTAACVTLTLFIAVALGLTGEDAGAVIPAAPAMASAAFPHAA
jgi:hypothetical protein